MKKGVKREFLFIVSGIMWSGVGIMLNLFSLNWFLHILSKLKYLSISSGIFFGILISLLGFNKLAKKNINRIINLNNYTCIFNFQEVKSYFIIIFMIGLGIFMRKSGFFGKEILIFVYSSIGTALFLSSIHYYKRFIKDIQSFDNKKLKEYETEAETK